MGQGRLVEASALVLCLVKAVDEAGELRVAVFAGEVRSRKDRGKAFVGGGQKEHGAFGMALGGRGHKGREAQIVLRSGVGRRKQKLGKLGVACGGGQVQGGLAHAVGGFRVGKWQKELRAFEPSVACGFHKGAFAVGVRLLRQGMGNKPARACALALHGGKKQGSLAKFRVWACGGVFEGSGKAPGIVVRNGPQEFGDVVRIAGGDGSGHGHAEFFCCWNFCAMFWAGNFEDCAGWPMKGLAGGLRACLRSRASGALDQGGQSLGLGC